MTTALDQPLSLALREATARAHEGAEGSNLITPIPSQLPSQIDFESITALQTRIGHSTRGCRFCHGTHGSLQRLIHKPQLTGQIGDSFGI